MANNEYVNKVLFGDLTVMDISDTTAEAGDVILGQTFYTKSGAPATGSLGDATLSTHGLMSTTDKIKLDGIEEIDPYETINTPAPLIHLTNAAEAVVKEMEIEINPVLDFNGYDRPWFGGIGKNKLPVYGHIAHYPSSVISGFHTYVDGHIFITGTSLADFDAWLCNDGKFRVNPSEEIIGIFHYSGNYIISGSSTNPPAIILFYNIDTEEIDASGNGQFTLDGDYNIKIHCENNTKYNGIIMWPMLRLASIADDTFEPYLNICPITGYTGIQLRTANKNLFSINFDTFTNSGITFSSENSYIIMNGTQQYGLAILTFSSNKIYLPAGTYNIDYRLVSGTVEGATQQNYGSICIYRSRDSKKLLLRYINYSTQLTNSTFTFTQGENIYIGIDKRDYVTFTNAKFLLTITRAEDTITNGILHEGKVYDISFPTTAETVYGGTLTINNDKTGTLTITKGYYKASTTDDWNLLLQSGLHLGVYTNAVIMKNDDELISNLFVKSGNNIGISKSGVNFLQFNCIELLGITTVEEFKLFITDNDIYVIYTLADENIQTISLTVPQIATLLDNNNIWANSGNINKLIYGKNINGLINGADKVKLDYLAAVALEDATLSTHGLMSTADKTKLDGITAGANKPVFLTYGSSTWNDAITAYNNGAQLYCLASTSMDTPGSGTMSRIAQLVYVAIGSGETVPYLFEFLYFRSIANKTTSLLSDLVLVYKLDQNEGWSFSYRYVSIGEVSTSNGITASYNNDILTLSGPGVMTGATSSTAGTSGSVPAPTTSDVNKFLAGDGTYKSGGLPMVILSYGNSTWADFEAAYNNNVIVYCRASSQSNPATGSQTRMAFMAYVNDASSPTNVEFLYYRSVSSHSSTLMGDQVYVYKLDKTSGWSVTTREASIKLITGSGISVSWSSNKVTLTNGITVSDSLTDTSTTKALSAAKGKALLDTIGNTTMGTTATTLTGAINEINTAITPVSVGTRNENVSEHSVCYRIGNIVVCTIRYDRLPDINLFTDLPAAANVTAGMIFGDATHYGLISISANGTSLGYTNKGVAQDMAKWGTLVYITNE